MSYHKWFFTIFSENVAFLKLRLNIHSLCAAPIVMPHLVSHLTSPHQAVSQSSPGLILLAQQMLSVSHKITHIAVYKEDTDEGLEDEIVGASGPTY